MTVEPTIPAEPTHPSNRRILLVDDSPAIHEDFRKVLGVAAGNRRYELTSAFHGDEAVARVRAAVAEGNPFSMAFIDVRVPPGWDGIETVSRIWNEQPDLEVVICTAFSDYDWDQLLGKLERSEQVIILKKPFDKIEVQQLALALTEKWRLRKQAENAHSDLRRHLEEEIALRERSEHDLRQAQKLEAVGRLAAGVAHEINTPIQFVSDSCQFLREAIGDIDQVIAGYQKVVASAGDADALREALVAIRDEERDRDLDYLLEHVPRAVERVMDGAQRIAKIVRALKQFAHPGQEKKVPVDLNPTIENTVTLARGEYKDVAELELDLGVLPPVLCSASEIGQVVLNIVVNAAHAVADVVQRTGERGRIRVGTRRDLDHVLIEIGDTGGGIADEIRAKVFDPFFTTKEVGRGTGQGLAIARSVIVDKHGGTLSFESTVGSGTTFLIRIPIARVSTASMSVEAVGYIG